MRFSDIEIAEDEKRWRARDIIAETGYCGAYIKDRKDITNHDLRFYGYVFRKAHELLTPRVLTLEEVRNGALEIGWLEDFDKCDVIPGIRFRLVNEGGDEAVEFHVMDGFIAPRLAYYGELWRCWDKRPTNEQRLTTPWNKQLLQYADEDVLQGGLAPAT